MLQLVKKEKHCTIYQIFSTIIYDVDPFDESNFY